MLSYFRFELRRLVRDPRLMMFAVVTPVISYIVFSGVSANTGDRETDLDIASTLMIGLAGYGAVFGALSVGGNVSVERASGWLRQLRATPLSPFDVVVVRAFIGTLTAIPAVVGVGLTAYLQHGVTFPVGRWAAILGLLWLGTIPFALLGLAVGYAMSPQVAQPVTFLSFFLLSVLGGLLVPVQVFPVVLQRIADGLPTYRYAELGWRAAAGELPGGGGLAVLLGWTALFAVLAGYAYRRFAAVR